MKIQREIDKYYYFTWDDRKLKIGNCDPVDEGIYWSYFYYKDEFFQLEKPMVFKMESGKFSGSLGDFQFNPQGFLLFSDKLRAIFEKYLTPQDKPIWFPAKVIDLDNKEYNYSILYFFGMHDLLDHVNSTFIDGTDHPIKQRFDLEKIGDRLIFSTKQSKSMQICVHDIVRKEIKQAGCTGVYCFKIHTAGRLV